jgi:hypothetical protein
MQFRLPFRLQTGAVRHSEFSQVARLALLMVCVSVLVMMQTSTDVLSTLWVSQVTPSDAEVAATLLGGQSIASGVRRLGKIGTPLRREAYV